MRAMEGRTLMITGGTGSFGSTVLDHFVGSDVGEVRVFSRDEKKPVSYTHLLEASRVLLPNGTSMRMR